MCHHVAAMDCLCDFETCFGDVGEWREILLWVCVCVCLCSVYVCVHVCVGVCVCWEGEIEIGLMEHGDPLEI